MYSIASLKYSHVGVVECLILGLRNFASRGGRSRCLSRIHTSLHTAIRFGVEAIPFSTGDQTPPQLLISKCGIASWKEVLQAQLIHIVLEP